jgi:hypothetical protein
MHLIDGDWGIQRIVPLPLLQPLLVFPAISKLPDDGGCFGRCFMVRGKRVCLIYLVAFIAGGDVIFVNSPLTYPGNKSFPYPGLSPGAKRMAGSIPAVKVTYDRYLFGVGCPHCKICPFLVIYGQWVGAQFLIQLEVRALVEKVEVIVSQEGHLG